MSTLPFQGGGHFQYFRPGFRFWHICHVDRHGHFTLKQLRLPVLNETHTNSYLQILDYYMEMDFPGFIPKTKYIVPCNGTLFNLQGHIFLLQGHKVCQKTHCFNAWIVGHFTWAKMSGYLRGSPCKNRPLEFLKITEFLHTFCVEEVIHKMNKKRWLWNCSQF
jgi:hypothetical protein